jgi:hypothetical protein
MNGRRNISSSFANTGRDAHLASDSPAESDMPMNLPPLRTLFFEDLSIGMTERLEKTVASSDVVGFAQLTGDRNPIHLSEHFAAKTSFRTRIAHGLYTASLISAVLGTRRCGLHLADAELSRPSQDWRYGLRHCHRRRTDAGKIPRPFVLPLRGRRRGGLGRRSTGEGTEREGSEGQAAGDEVVRNS